MDPDRAGTPGPTDPSSTDSVSVVVATDLEVLLVDVDAGRVLDMEGLGGARPTCLAGNADGGVWCGTRHDGVFRAHRGGTSWTPAGLSDSHVMSLAVGPGTPGTLWAGAEPSVVQRRSTAPNGGDWEPTAELTTLPSSSGWAFPPRPETHHVRWITCHPADPERLWLAIEAGALVSTSDGGRTWRDRVPGSPRDTHELALHPVRPDVLHSAAGDGYFRSDDAGASWSREAEGLDVGYFRSTAIDPGDPDVVLMSGASGPRTAYVTNHADGRLFRREGKEAWRPVLDGWPDPPATIAPLLVSGRVGGELWAADERGVHRTDDGGHTWERVAAFDPVPNHLRGLVLAPPIA